MAITALSHETARALGSSQSITGPLSVIKELLDNALDALASCVTVEISADSLSAIQVKDNGRGVPPADRALLARANCTSKFVDTDDLAMIGRGSLGFRGQALNLITAMSKSLTITTRVEGESTGTVLYFDQEGSLVNERRTSHAVGTTVHVQELYQSLPVRRTNLKKRTIRTIHEIRALLQRYAIARPHVRLSFSTSKLSGREGRWIFHGSHDGQLLDAARKILDTSLTSRVEFRQHENADMHISALLPRVNATADKGNVHHAFVSVDGRPLDPSRGFAKTAIKLVKDRCAANSTTPHARPVLICIDVRTEATAYDINIEPSKDDVLFSDEVEVLKCLGDLLSTYYDNSNIASSETPNTVPAAMTETQMAKAEVSRTAKLDARSSGFIEESSHMKSSCSNESNEAETDFSVSNEDDECASHDKFVSNPWTFAKLNTFHTRRLRRSGSSEDFVLASPSGMLTSAPIQNPEIGPFDTGLITPLQSSPVRQPFSYSPQHRLQMDTMGGLRARGLVIHTDMTMAPPSPTPTLVSLASQGRHPSPLHTRLQSQAPLSSVTRGNRTSLPFKSPVKYPNKVATHAEVARVDRERDAWFKTPQMARDQQARKRAKLDKEAPQSFAHNDDVEVSSNLDIRNFLQATPPTRAVNQDSCDNIAHAPALANAGRQNDLMQVRQSHVSLPTTDAFNRPPASTTVLREIDINTASDPRTVLLRPRTKTNTLRRAKSSMLPLERIPKDKETCGLSILICVKAENLAQGASVLKKHHSSEPLVLADGLDLPPAMAELSQFDMQNITDGLRELLGTNLVADFDAVVTAALIHSVASRTPGTEELVNDLLL